MVLIHRIGALAAPLTIVCATCQHRALWPPETARARLGGHCTVADARRRLRCGVCGERRSSHIGFSEGEGRR